MSQYNQNQPRATNNPEPAVHGTAPSYVAPPSDANYAIKHGPPYPHRVPPPRDHQKIHLHG